MKKIVLLLIVTFSLMGCEMDALNYYQEAVKKTETIEMGKSVLDLNFELDFSDEFTELEPNFVDLLKEINYKSHSEFNLETMEAVNRQYIGNDAFGVDIIHYKNKDEHVIKVPFTGKFLVLDPETLIEGIDFSVYDESPISEAVVREIKDKWFNLVHEEDVVNLGDEVIDTPEGEVKVKKMVVSFSNDQIHRFLDDVLLVMANDDLFKEQIKKYPTYSIVNNKLVESDDFELDVDDAIEAMRAIFDDVIVDEMKFISYIDIDKYMIQHEYEVSLSFKGDLEGIIESIKFTSDFQLFDLHEENKFNFPVLENDNTITINEITEQLNFEIPNEK